MSTPKITEAEWLAELEKFFPGDSITAEGFTVQDVQEATGHSKAKILQLIRGGIRRGSIQYIGDRIDLRIDGRPCRRPAYKIT